MRKLILSLIATAILHPLCSCSNNDKDGGEDYDLSGVETISAYIEEGENSLRTTQEYGSDSVMHNHWKLNDEIKIVRSSERTASYSCTNENSADGNFKYKAGNVISEIFNWITGESRKEALYGLYPGNGNTFSNIKTDEATLNFPTEQTCSDGKLNGVYPMVATGEIQKVDNQNIIIPRLGFKNIASLIKFEVSSASGLGIESITFTTNSIGSKGKLTFGANREPIVEMGTPKNGFLGFGEIRPLSIKLSCGGKQLSSTPENFIMAIPAGEYKDLKFEIKYGNNKTTTIEKENITFAMSKFKKLKVELE